jgi:hypothetical protein
MTDSSTGPAEAQYRARYLLDGRRVTIADLLGSGLLKEASPSSNVLVGGAGVTVLWDFRAGLGWESGLVIVRQRAVSG